MYLFLYGRHCRNQGFKSSHTISTTTICVWVSGLVIFFRSHQNDHGNMFRKWRWTGEPVVPHFSPEKIWNQDTYDLQSHTILRCITSLRHTPGFISQKLLYFCSPDSWSIYFTVCFLPAEPTGAVTSSKPKLCDRSASCVSARRWECQTPLLLNLCLAIKPGGYKPQAGPNSVSFVISSITL